MDEVGSQIMSTLQNHLKTSWNGLFDPSFAELISGSKLQSTELQEQQHVWWERLQPHRDAWTRRQAGSIARRKARQLGTGQTLTLTAVTEADLSPVVEKLRHALRQLILVQTLLDEKLSREQEKRIREELWLELAPQVERVAHCYQKSAAKRGFEVDDLIQEASAHFQQVITRFNPDDSRRAMLSTWFDDVVDNLFAAAVRPRKSDTLKRGLGGPGDEDTASDDVPSSPKQSLRYVRDYRRQQDVAESLRQVDEICSQLVETGVCPFERVLAFKLYVCEGLTYQEVAETLRGQGYPYGTTQMFNFVKEVKAHVLGRFEGNPFASE